MALRKLRYEQDEILRKKSKPVLEITPKILTLLDDMAETMREKDGAGLAAPQVGILKRVVLVDGGEEMGILELINPELLEKEGTQQKKEGCLSLPGKVGIVERPAYVKVKAQNRQGKEIIIEGTEMTAVALCHEIDHLDGILYVDKVLSFVVPEEDEEEEAPPEKKTGGF